MLNYIHAVIHIMQKDYMANTYFVSFINAMKTDFPLTANFKVLLATH